MGTAKKVGPMALTAAAANILNGGGGSASLADRVKHIHIANKSALDATFDLYVGATGGSAAGTELFKSYSVPANTAFDWYGDMPLASTEFLTGLASAITTLVILVEYEREAV